MPRLVDERCNVACVCSLDCAFATRRLDCARNLRAMRFERVRRVDERRVCDAVDAENACNRRMRAPALAS